MAPESAGSPLPAASSMVNITDVQVPTHFAIQSVKDKVVRSLTVEDPVAGLEVSTPHCVRHATPEVSVNVAPL